MPRVKSSLCNPCLVRSRLLCDAQNSTNGVFVNELRVQEKRLEHGDVVQFGGAAGVPVGTRFAGSESYIRCDVRHSGAKGANREAHLWHLMKSFAGVRTAPMALSVCRCYLRHYSSRNWFASPRLQVSVLSRTSCPDTDQSQTATSCR